MGSPVTHLGVTAVADSQDGVVESHYVTACRNLGTERNGGSVMMGRKEVLDQDAKF